MNQQYKNELDRQIAESLEKPGKDDGPILFDYLFKTKEPKEKNYCPVCGDEIDLDAKFCSDGCQNQFYEEQEIEVDEEEEEIEVLHKEEKRGKAIS